MEALLWSASLYLFQVYAELPSAKTIPIRPFTSILREGEKKNLRVRGLSFALTLSGYGSVRTPPLCAYPTSAKNPPLSSPLPRERDDTNPFDRAPVRGTFRASGEKSGPTTAYSHPRGVH